MKILFACRSFDNMAGGVERMAIAIMGAMCERGHDVSLLTWDRDGAASFYPMDSRISWHKLDLGDHLPKAGWGLRLKRARKVRRIVSALRPDVIIGFQHGTFISMRLFTLGLGSPVVAAERNAPHRFDHIAAGKHQGFIMQTFRLANRITIQCESYRSRYPAAVRPRMVTIPNPVFPAAGFAEPAGTAKAQKILLSVGRLSFQKNQMVLLDAFAGLAPEFPEWHLTLAGEGEDRKTLEARIEAHGLQERVSLPGAVRDVSSLYTASHLFCLPSRWEGFPNALAEAMSHGLPCVGFAECAGVRDLVRHGENGLLAEGNCNPRSLAVALREAMSDASLREEMGRNGIASMRDYGPEKIFDQWDAFFRAVART